MISKLSSLNDHLSSFHKPKTYNNAITVIGRMRTTKKNTQADYTLALNYRAGPFTCSKEKQYKTKKTQDTTVHYW